MEIRWLLLLVVLLQCFVLPAQAKKKKLEITTVVRILTLGKCILSTHVDLFVHTQTYQQSKPENCNAFAEPGDSLTVHYTVSF